MIHLDSDNGFGISVLAYGATWASCRVPLRDGSRREVLLGCGESAYRLDPCYQGATIGRFANRIRHGEFTCDGQHHQLDRNSAGHCLHGGAASLAKRDWNIEEITSTRARFSIWSADGESGFPGQLTAEVTYSIDARDRSVTIEFLAAVDRPCPVSLTNHAYFNLDRSGGDCRQHRLRLAASEFWPIDEDGVPVGQLAPVAGSPFDFRQPVRLDVALQAHPQLSLNRGYNHSFRLGPFAIDPQSAERAAAELFSSNGDLSMRVFTTLPALHVYTGNYLAGAPGRDGSVHADYAGVALEAQFPPDSPNHPQWPTPDSILRPGAIYRHRTRFQFDEPAAER